MEKTKRLVWIASMALVGLGLVALILNLILGWSVNFTWPLVVMILGAVFIILAGALVEKWWWAAFFYIPAMVLLALGLIFLLNIVTNDWNAWAYAWLLAVAGLGLGVVLANRELHGREGFTVAGMAVFFGGITLAVLFGAVMGGRFMLVMAPILLVVGGLALRWLVLETPLLERFLRRVKPGDAKQPVAVSAAPAPATEAQPSGLAPDQAGLVEPLSGRELEVLRLIEQGLSNSEIAEQLTLAPSTVKTHINNIYGKLGVQTRIQAVKRAQELGL
jgi:DNA-binding CsgD family transcriptional regulator